MAEKKAKRGIQVASVVVGVALFLGGATAVAFAAADALAVRDFAAQAELAQGRVIDFVDSEITRRRHVAPVRNSRNRVWRRVRRGQRVFSVTSVFPVIAFSTPDGREFEFEALVGGTTPDYQLGERVRVMYNPENPTEARIGETENLWGIPIVLGGFGLIVAAIGLGFGIGGAKKLRTSVS
jgi:hypothetical protein